MYLKAVSVICLKKCRGLWIKLPLQKYVWMILSSVKDIPMEQYTYASAAHNAHPEDIQVSDRFHLIKNLSDIVEKYLYQLFPSRLSVLVDKVNPKMLALYNTRNRAERIMFAHKKRKEGYTLNDTILLLHIGATTVNKYLKDDCLVINGGYDN